MSVFWFKVRWLWQMCHVQFALMRKDEFSVAFNQHDMYTSDKKLMAQYQKWLLKKRREAHERTL